jgi:hypothetical protein
MEPSAIFPNCTAVHSYGEVAFPAPARQLHLPDDLSSPRPSARPAPHAVVPCLASGLSSSPSPPSSKQLLSPRHEFRRSPAAVPPCGLVVDRARHLLVVMGNQRASPHGVISSRHRSARGGKSCEI